MWKSLSIVMVLSMAPMVQAVERVVGVTALSGGATLVKQVHVQGGTEVAQIEFVSNDLSTVFPAIRLRRLNGKAAGDVVAEVRNVVASNSSRHRFLVSVAPVVFLEDEDVLVEVVLPSTNAADRIGAGVGLGANNLNGAPATSYIGNTSNGDLQPIDVDLCISVLRNATAGKAGQWPPGGEPPADRPSPLALLVRTSVGGEIEVLVTTTAAVAASVEVYDVKGALVRTLSRGSVAAGEHTLTWDRRDTHGQRIAAGVYFIAARVGDAGTIRKTVVLH